MKHETTEDTPTIEELAMALGLDDPWEYAVRQIAENVSYSTLCVKGAKKAHAEVYHVTGRTMRMKLRALAHVVRGKTVRFEAHTTAYARKIAREVRDMAIDLGVVTGGCHDMVIPKGGSDESPIIFGDHHMFGAYRKK